MTFEVCCTSKLNSPETVMRTISKYSVFLLLSCLLAFSCEQRKNKEEYSLPKFKQEFTREFEILGSELELGLVSSIKTYKDYLILLGQNRWTKQYLQIIDKKTGEIIHGSAAFGRGPGEVLHPNRLSMIGQECYVYDPSSDVAQVYDVEQILRGEVGYIRTIRDLDIPPFTVGCFYGPGARLIFRNETFIQREGSQPMPRIILDLDEAQYTYDEYPVPDRVRSYWMYMTPYLTISPDFSKMAVVPAYGAILERFSLSGGITLMGVDRFIAPDFTIVGTNPDFSEHAIPYGFTNLTSTNDKIFVGMVGEVVSGLGTRSLEYPHFPILAVFDWEGHPLVGVRNSRNIECLGYDEEDGMVYAVLRDSDNERYLGKMRI